MAKWEMKDGQGTLFKNGFKETDKHPDYKGECQIDGSLYEMAAWIKDGAKGKFLSMSIKPKDTDRAPKDGGLSGKSAPVDDDIPF